MPSATVTITGLDTNATHRLSTNETGYYEAPLLDGGKYTVAVESTGFWEVPRLWCPFCGNHDHEGLRFLHAEGEETKYRALVCEVCRGYIKMLTTLSALPPLPLLVADAATLHLDLAAAERGYTPTP